MIWVLCYIAGVLTSKDRMQLIGTLIFFDASAIYIVIVRMLA